MVLIFEIYVLFPLQFHQIKFPFQCPDRHFDAISFQEPNNEFVLIVTMEVLGNQLVGFRLLLALVTSVIF